MKLNCRKCAAEIPAKNINIQRILAVCAQCDYIFDFSPEIGGCRIQSQTRGFVPRPKDLHVRNHHQQIFIRYRWLNVMQLPGLILQAFLIIISLITTFYSAQAFMFGAICFAILSIIGCYSFFANLFNSTEIIIEPKKICVNYLPIYWFGNMELNRVSILQLYGKEIKIGSKNQMRLYELHAIGQDKVHKKIARFPTPEHALFIESVIEAYWKIEDVPVRGEIAR